MCEIHIMLYFNFGNENDVLYIFKITNLYIKELLQSQTCINFGTHLFFLEHLLLGTFKLTLLNLSWIVYTSMEWDRGT